MLIAAQLYTVREQLTRASDLRGILGRLRDIGYVAVEVAGLQASVAEELESELQRAGLVACACHVGLEEIEASAPRCKAWGCRYVVVPSLPAEYQSRAGFQRFASEAEGIAGKLRPLGLELAYHNHDFELPIGLEILFTGGLKAELDVFWLKHGGADPVEWIRRLAGRLPLVHLKDMAQDGRQTEVGEGILDWPAILGACREAGVEWLVVERDEGERDPMESLEISYRNLARLLPSGASGATSP